RAPRAGVQQLLSDPPSSVRTNVRLHCWGWGMDERLGRVLRERVEAYLGEVERMLRGADPGAAWPAVRARLLPLAAAWRNLLGQHGSGLRGRCQHCDRALRLCRRRAALCSVWRTAHAYLGGGWPADGGL